MNNNTKMNINTKIILVVTKKKKVGNKLCYYIKKEFIKKDVCTVHPLHYAEFFDNKEIVHIAAYNRVINFIEKNKERKKNIIIDNYNMYKHLIYQLRIRNTPITHFICDHDSKDFNSILWVNNNIHDQTLKKYFKVQKHNIIKNLYGHPKNQFVSPLPHTHTYNLVKSEIDDKFDSYTGSYTGYTNRKNSININENFFLMFFLRLRKTCYLFNFKNSQVYIVNPLETQKLKNLIKDNFLLLKLNPNPNSKSKKLNFGVVSKFDYKGNKVISSEGIYFENNILRIL